MCYLVDKNKKIEVCSLSDPRVDHDFPAILIKGGNKMPEQFISHYGVLGMKWGVRRTPEQLGYRSTNVNAMFAKRANRKVDSGFKNWEENAKKKEAAIDLGKKANIAKRASERDPSNKELKTVARQTQKEYKKALATNTHYRQGAIRKEVGSDLSRKYLSDAKKVKKNLLGDPNNKQLQKQYNELMSNHAVERKKARRAQEVGQKRSNTIASMKRARTMAIKTVATTAAVSAGVAATNVYLQKQGKQGITVDMVDTVIKKGKQLLDYAGYFY